VGLQFSSLAGLRLLKMTPSGHSTELLPWAMQQAPGREKWAMRIKLESETSF
jgi:hypothetical protein